MRSLAVAAIFCFITVTSGLMCSKDDVGAPFLCPHLALSGQRVKGSNNPAVYLVLDGIRRHIPNPDTYNNLFKSWHGINILNVEHIPLGPALSDGAKLAKSPTDDAVYLISNGEKRWIVSPPAFDKYHFDWKKIVNIPQVAIDAIPRGKDIS